MRWNSIFTEQLRQGDSDGDSTNGVEVAFHVALQARDAALGVDLKVMCRNINNLKCCGSVKK